MNLPPSVEAYASYIDTTKQAVTDTYAAERDVVNLVAVELVADVHAMTIAFDFLQSAMSPRAFAQ